MAIVLTSTDALNHQAVNTYNSLNEVLTTTDPNGVTTTMTYSAQGNLLTTAAPLVGAGQSAMSTLIYGDASHAGDVTCMVDPNGKTWTYVYDSYGNRTSQTDPLGDKISSTFNTIGWKLTAVTPRGDTTTFGYTDAVSGLNKFGDVISVTDPLGHLTTQHYDAARNVDRITDPDGNVTGYTFDLANELILSTRADNTKLQTIYNLDGSVSQQIDGKGGSTSYAYDALGHLVSVTDPLSRVTRATYDAAGNKLTLLDAQSQTTAFTYDAANRLTGITHSDGKTPNISNLTYDSDGQRLSMTDGTVSSTWVWDSLHRLTSSKDGANNTVGYGYDLKGQMTSLSYPGKRHHQFGVERLRRADREAVKSPNRLSRRVWYGLSCARLSRRMVYPSAWSARTARVRSITFWMAAALATRWLCLRCSSCSKGSSASITPSPPKFNHLAKPLHASTLFVVEVMCPAVAHGSDTRAGTPFGPRGPVHERPGRADSAGTTNPNDAITVQRKSRRP